MSLYKTHARKMKATIEGAPCELGLLDNDPSKVITIYVARAHESNPEYKTALATIRRKHAKTIDSLPTEQRQEFVEKLSRKALREVCVKGWSNMVDDNDAPLVFNAANLNKVLDDLPEAEDALINFASDASNYLGEFNAEDSEKN